MRRILSLFIVLSIGLITSCKEEKELYPNLKLESLTTTVYLNKTIDVKILSGSGKYSANSMDEGIAKPTLTDNILSIKGISLGNVIIEVTDTKSHQSAQINVTVKEDEIVMALIDSEVLELKSINSNKEIKDLPHEKIKDYWGDRIAYSTPNELRFKNDSLYITKPNNLIEKYKTEWRGDKLYLNYHNSTEWLYYGVRNPENNQFSINTIFYKGVCKNEVRSLSFIKQSYENITLSDISDNYPDASIVWAKMNFIFKNKQ